MKINIVILFSTIITSAFLATSCNSTKSHTEILPECEIAYNGIGEPFSQIIENTRPKVVVCNNMLAKNISKETLFNDVELLRKQIEEFSEFDFIFYISTSCDNTPRVATIAKENNIKAVIIIDSTDTFRTLNKLDARVIASAMILDSKLRPHPSALPGVRFSPFSSEANKFLKQHY